MWKISIRGHHQVADQHAEHVESQVRSKFDEFVARLRAELPFAGVVDAKFEGEAAGSSTPLSSAQADLDANRSPGQRAAASMGAIVDTPQEPINRPRPNPAVIAEGGEGEDAATREADKPRLPSDLTPKSAPASTPESTATKLGETKPSNR